MRIGLERTASPDNAHPLARLGIGDLLRRLTTDPAPRLLAHSALLGLGVVALLCLLAWRPSRGPVVPWLKDGAAPSLFWRRLCLRWLPAWEFWPWVAPPCCARDSSQAVSIGLAGLWMERIGLAFDPFVFPAWWSSWGLAWRSCPGGWPPGWSRRVGTTPVPGGLTRSGLRVPGAALPSGMSGAGRGGSRYRRWSSGERWWQRPSLRPGAGADPPEPADRCGYRGPDRPAGRFARPVGHLGPDGDRP